MAFDVFSCAWVGCLYSSLPARADKIQRLRDPPHSTGELLQRLNEGMALNPRVRLIDIPMAYERVIYHWSHAELEEGIRVGFEGACTAALANAHR